MVASIPEMTGALTEANLKAGEGDAAVGQAIELLERTTAVLAEAIELNAAVLGSSSANSVNEALGYFQSAQNQVANAMRELERVQGSIRGGSERNEEYIGLLNS